ncbi:hypothetical protein Acsp05_21470 [Actinokineospora sp. NBRC 105648]|nr:hypothetical protein Acsp05_21470 [Actinokineospora sp. NBRC 105648]
MAQEPSESAVPFRDWPGWGRDWNVPPVPGEMVKRWQEAYRRFGQAYEATAKRPPGDVNAARELAEASWNVAVLWREIAGTAGLPWWLLASLNAAAQAFEQQARDWNARSRVDVDVAPGHPRVRRDSGTR